jgi:hypothetical protein
MAKVLAASRPTRDHHKQRNSWVVIDLEKAKAALARASHDPKNRAIAGHEGILLDICRRDCIVARLEGAYTEYSARLFASSGGFAKYRQMQRLGQPVSRKYMDESSFAVVETEVLAYWLGLPRIDWDAQAARSHLYAKRGLVILPFLCTSFIPPGEDEDEYQASLPGIARRERQAGPVQRSAESGRSRAYNPVQMTVYRIVDLDDFRNRRRDLVIKCVDGGLKPLDLPAEGLLFRRSTIASFKTSGWRKALERFRSRAFGEMERSLPYGRFVALPDSVWEILVKLPNLPLGLSRQHLVEAAKEASKLETAANRKAAESARRSEAFAWLPSCEPGMDDVKQLPLPGTQLLKDILEFPPRAHGSRLRRLVEGKLPRIIPAKRQGRRMRQLGLPQIPRFAVQASGQACLCACDKPNPLVALDESMSAVIGPLVPETQLALRFPRPSNEWSQPPLIPGIEPAPRRPRFVPRRRVRVYAGQTRLPFGG